MMQELEKKLSEAVASRDAGRIMQVLGSIAQKKGGMLELAETTGLSRGNLYRTFWDQANPKLEALLAILEALDLELKIEVKQARRV